MYEVKCLIEDTLDIIENLTDGLLNGIPDLLSGYLGQASNVCNSQIKLVGFCV